MKRIKQNTQTRYHNHKIIHKLIEKKQQQYFIENWRPSSLLGFALKAFLKPLSLD